MRCINGLTLLSFGYSKGRINAPKTAQLKISAAIISKEFCQLKLSSKNVANGANANVPTPDPHTAVIIFN
jgi:hypothetical protein